MNFAPFESISEKMRGALNIAAKTRKLDVDNRLSLKLYYRTADNLLKQVCHGDHVMVV